jgi:hypothetical protein
MNYEHHWGVAALAKFGKHTMHKASARLPLKSSTLIYGNQILIS